MIVSQIKSNRLQKIDILTVFNVDYVICVKKMLTHLDDHTKPKKKSKTKIK